MPAGCRRQSPFFSERIILDGGLDVIDDLDSSGHDLCCTLGSPFRLPAMVVLFRASLIFAKSRLVWALRRITFSTGDLVALMLSEASVVILASSLPLRIARIPDCFGNQIIGHCKVVQNGPELGKWISRIGSSGDTSACCATWAKLFMLACAISDIRNCSLLQWSFLRRVWKTRLRPIFHDCAIVFGLLLATVVFNGVNDRGDLSARFIGFFGSDDQ